MKMKNYIKTIREATQWVLDGGNITDDVEIYEKTRATSG